MTLHLFQSELDALQTELNHRIEAKDSDETVRSTHPSLSQSPNHGPIHNSTSSSSYEEKNNEGDNDEVDYSCGICLNLNFQPIQLKPCGHVCFCKNCLHRLSLYGNNATFQCPLCRQKISSSSTQLQKIHKPTLNIIKAKFSSEYVHYQEQKQLEQTTPTSKTYQIAYGNRHKVVKNFAINRHGHENKHNWTSFVEVLNEKGETLNSTTGRMIEKVHFNFHRYFPPINIRPMSSKNQNKIEVSRNGWGYFDYVITIIFAKDLNMQSLVLETELSFDRNGVRCLHPIEMSIENLKKIKQAVPAERGLTVEERRARGDVARRESRRGRRS